MEDLRRYFSSEAIKNLENLKKNFQNANDFSELEKGEILRTLHTVKGSSQTFGFSSAGFLAHKLETLFSIIQSKEDFNGNSENLFLEGMELLIESLNAKHFEIPASFLENLDKISPENAENNFSETISPEIPAELSEQLSSQEKNALASALNAGKILYEIENGFDSTGFPAGFKKFRELLSESGEIIAALPSSKFNDSGKIGFRFIFVSYLPSAQIKKISALDAAQKISNDSNVNFSNDLRGVLSQITEHGRTLARKFDKQIEFKISSDELELSPQNLKLIFDVLTHLIRNAVDHAVEKEGEIQINLKIEKDNLKLSVSDDGRGIDLEKVKSKAVEKTFISADRNLTEQETLDLIFLPEFSTAQKLTEISGRGVGLDAVKNAVEKANGKINVKSRNGQGTTFEIFLPKDEE